MEKTPENYAQLFNDTKQTRKSEVLALILKWHYDKAFMQIRSRKFTEASDIVGVLDDVNKKFIKFSKLTAANAVSQHGFEIMVYKKDPEIYKVWYDSNSKISNKE